MIKTVYSPGIVKFLTWLLVYISISTPISAEEIIDGQHDHKDILRQAKHFIEADLEIDKQATNIVMKSLDNRLRLRQCTHALTPFWPPGARKAGHTSIGVRCNDHKPWKIFIGAEIQQFAEVWITRTAIARGTILDKNHVSLQRRDISKIVSQYMSSTQNPIGLMAKQPIRAGDIIKMTTLAKHKSVHRGDRVMVIARKNGLEIRTTATALTDAATGDRIRVRNLATKKELEGILHKDSTVYVNI